ncbi:MAG: hypothetical protein RLZZ74_3504 [Cyanobacteriota bacterium]|jgi:hypothetical protein
MDDKTLKERMISEALLILNSIDWLEKQINKKLGLLEEAQNNSLFDDIPLIEKDVHTLINKLSRENRNMDAFMLKYRQLIDYEKKAVLSNFKQKEQTHMRSVSQD